MDITELSINLNQVNLQNQISFALLKNVKEMAEVETEAIQELIASVSVPGVGEQIDISV